MFLVHADWSVSPGKRWAAEAVQASVGWEILDLKPVGPTAEFTRELLARSLHEPVIAGFDFPVGVPAAYGSKTGLAGFPALLHEIGYGAWPDFARVARKPSEITVQRPFYPATSEAGIKQAALLAAHNVQHLDELRRACERARPDRRAACPLFWTLGGNQVGRAALAGWLEVIRPAVEKGAKLWPFDGHLPELAAAPGLILAETYPTDAYGQVGLQLSANESKRRQSDRLTKVRAIEQWAERRQVRLSPGVTALVRIGFGEDGAGEDRFDALLGLMGMIEVMGSWRADAPRGRPEIDTWEGWILGQAEQYVTAGSALRPDTSLEHQGRVDEALVHAIGQANEATQAAVRRLLRTIES